MFRVLDKRAQQRVCEKLNLPEDHVIQYETKDDYRNKGKDSSEGQPPEEKSRARGWSDWYDDNAKRQKGGKGGTDPPKRSNDAKKDDHRYGR